MIVDEKLLKHLSELARLSLEEKEKDALLRDLEKILSYFSQIKGVRTENTPPFWQEGWQKNVLRKDEISVDFDFSDCLEQFSEREEDFLKVPKVLDKK